MVAGKGREDYQEIEGVKHHTSDREMAEEIFAGKSLSKATNNDDASPAGNN